MLVHTIRLFGTASAPTSHAGGMFASPPGRLQDPIFGRADWRAVAAFTAIFAPQLLASDSSLGLRLVS